MATYNWIGPGHLKVDRKRSIAPGETIPDDLCDKQFVKRYLKRGTIVAVEAAVDTNESSGDSGQTELIAKLEKAATLAVSKAERSRAAADEQNVKAAKPNAQQRTKEKATRLEDKAQLDADAAAKAMEALTEAKESSGDAGSDE